ncbi:hypothetical protein LXL04_020069 [Taraxacum kok-saghyz]
MTDGFKDDSVFSIQIAISSLLIAYHKPRERRRLSGLDEKTHMFTIRSPGVRYNASKRCTVCISSTEVTCIFFSVIWREQRRLKCYPQRWNSMVCTLVLLPVTVKTRKNGDEIV